MPNKRQGIYFHDKVWKRLQEYRRRVWGDHHSTSAIIERALREFLDREEEKDTARGGVRKGEGDAKG